LKDYDKIIDEIITLIYKARNHGLSKNLVVVSDNLAKSLLIGTQQAKKHDELSKIIQNLLVSFENKD